MPPVPYIINMEAASDDSAKLDSFHGRLKYIHGFATAAGSLVAREGETASEVLSYLMRDFIRIEQCNPDLRSPLLYPKG